MYSPTQRAGRTARPARLFLTAGLAAALAFGSSGAQAQAASPSAISTAIKDEGGKKDIRAFYKARDYRPLWIRGGALRPEAAQLLEIIRNADLDGLDPTDYKPRAIASLIEDARGGSPGALAEAEIRLSQALADYARDAARPARVDVHYVDANLAPVRPSRRDILDGAAAAPSLKAHLDTIGWMHPLYGKLRAALAHGGLNGAQRRVLRLNLERARALPARQDRYVLVDAAAQRLYLYENGRERDSMRVIVGKESQQTPMMAGYIRYTMVNPYWNVPPDLVAERIAPHVLSDGLSYLDSRGYEILSDWSAAPRVVDPATIDWRAVSNGGVQLRVRQKPGPYNAMGRMKFMFPNDLGVYLHDTPDKDIFGNSDRRASAGCVRLEDAPRLARWLFGKPLTVPRGGTEQQVNLPRPVPVYITYMTAGPEKDRIAFRKDIYGRDGVAMAGVPGSGVRAR
ncbi:L,D-transpeptidase family protein [Allosphingosinicella flava]|uniref:L,D-transpeptidase family protein n=1 Tax=Allosphingosinicella flava TaxID=2771430 RepID=A0A7T2GKL3_9SPHN|nr:L,D-transpeptidase family protein [Sphingosinicella flava]QPQ55248.1 L,D-transpeptidase family protein [Sphingosinicella flava]